MERQHLEVTGVELHKHLSALILLFSSFLFRVGVGNVASNNPPVAATYLSSGM